MTDKKQPPVFEILFEGKGIYPEEIPLGTLARALPAIQRLATGDRSLDVSIPTASRTRREIERPATGDRSLDFEEVKEEDGSLRLIGIRRGSAIFQVGTRSAAATLENLREVGRFLKERENATTGEFILSPIEHLSSISRTLGCTITLRESTRGKAVLARIEPDSYDSISKLLLVSGDTSFVGRIQRVGGATGIHCGLRVEFQKQMLICKVVHPDTARRLGERLYQEVVVQGTAQWFKTSWRIFRFTIHDMKQPKQGSICDAFKELREAGGKGWDAIEDPSKYLDEVSGSR